MPTHKTSHSQSKSFSCSPTAVQSWPGSKHHAGLTFGKHWDLRRMWPRSMKQRGREEESKQTHYTAVGSVEANFPDAKWDRLTGFWQQINYFCLLLWQTVCERIVWETKFLQNVISVATDREEICIIQNVIFSKCYSIQLKEPGSLISDTLPHPKPNLHESLCVSDQLKH